MIDVPVAATAYPKISGTPLRRELETTGRIGELIRGWPRETGFGFDLLLRKGKLSEIDLKALRDIKTIKSIGELGTDARSSFVWFIKDDEGKNHIQLLTSPKVLKAFKIIGNSNFENFARYMNALIKSQPSDGVTNIEFLKLMAKKEGRVVAGAFNAIRQIGAEAADVLTSKSIMEFLKSGKVDHWPYEVISPFFIALVKVKDQRLMSNGMLVSFERIPDARRIALFKAALQVESMDMLLSARNLSAAANFPYDTVRMVEFLIANSRKDAGARRAEMLANARKGMAGKEFDLVFGNYKKVGMPIRPRT